MRKSNIKNKKILEGAESRYIDGNEIGCLLIHGFKSSPFEMLELGTLLSEQGYTISIPLLPGHGTSYKDLRRSAWGEWYEEVEQAYGELRKKCAKVFVTCVFIANRSKLDLWPVGL